MSLQTPRRIFARQKRRQGWWHSPRAATGMALAIAIAGSVWLWPDFQQIQPFSARSERLTLAAAATTVSVVDGNTLRVDGAVVHLDGVAAPASGQVCGRQPNCADQATANLTRLVRDHPVQCQLTGGGNDGTCQANGVQINAAMVSSGWARARTDAPLLVSAEQAARAQHLGLWAER